MVRLRPLLEAIDQWHKLFGRSDVGVLLARQLDQLHRFVALLAPGDQDLERLDLERLELGGDPGRLGPKAKVWSLPLSSATACWAIRRPIPGSVINSFSSPFSTAAAMS